MALGEYDWFLTPYRYLNAGILSIHERMIIEPNLWELSSTCWS